MAENIPDLIKTLKNSKSFTVPGIGTFWPLISTAEATASYVEFENVPPHYHTKTTETFNIISGSGFIEYGPPLNPGLCNPELFSDRTEKINWFNKKSEVEKIRGGLSVQIPPYMPHRMVKNESCEFIGTILFCNPPLEPKDDIELKIVYP